MPLSDEARVYKACPACRRSHTESEPCDHATYCERCHRIMSREALRPRPLCLDCQREELNR